MASISERYYDLNSPDEKSVEENWNFFMNVTCKLLRNISLREFSVLSLIYMDEHCFKTTAYNHARNKRPEDWNEY